MKRDKIKREEVIADGQEGRGERDRSNRRSLGKDGSFTYHIDQQIQRALPPLHQLRRVVLLPPLRVPLAEIASEGFLAPGAVDGVGDGREGGHGLVFARVFEELQPAWSHPFSMDDLRCPFRVSITPSSPVAPHLPW